MRFKIKTDLDTFNSYFIDIYEDIFCQSSFTTELDTHQATYFTQSAAYCTSLDCLLDDIDKLNDELLCNLNEYNLNSIKMTNSLKKYSITNEMYQLLSYIKNKGNSTRQIIIKIDRLNETKNYTKSIARNNF